MEPNFSRHIFTTVFRAKGMYDREYQSDAKNWTSTKVTNRVSLRMFSMYKAEDEDEDEEEARQEYDGGYLPGLVEHVSQLPMRLDKEERGQERAQVSKAVGKYKGDGVALHQADEVFEGTEGHEITGREEQRKPSHPLSSFLGVRIGRGSRGGERESE